MSIDRIANRYAKALYGSAEEQSKLKEVLADLGVIEEAYNASAEFRMLLESPTISSQEKDKALSKLFEKSGFCDLTLNFLKLLAKKKRLDIFASILSALHRLIDEKNNVVDAVLETTLEISKEQEQKILAYLEKSFNKTIRLKKKINQSIGGGFKVVVDDKMIDSSVVHQLKRLHKQLLSA